MNSQCITLLLLLTSHTITSNLLHFSNHHLAIWEVDFNHLVSHINNSNHPLNNIHLCTCHLRITSCSHLQTSEWGYHPSIMRCHLKITILNLTSKFLKIMELIEMNQILIDLRVAQWMILRQDLMLLRKCERDHNNNQY